MRKHSSKTGTIATLMAMAGAFQYGAETAEVQVKNRHDHFKKPYLHGNVRSISIKKKVRAAQKRR